MRIAKPLLLVATPTGVVGAIYEAYRLAGGAVCVPDDWLVLGPAATSSVALEPDDSTDA